MSRRVDSALTRRSFLASAATALAAQVPGERPERAAGVEILNPLDRVPVSFIIDDSTCLVNLNHFAIPQFRAAWADGSYAQDWRKMPVEIPDDFVRRFGDWASEKGVKGKYSIVPYPACVGRLDRELPGWTPEQVQASIRLVRERMTPNWDIHPEMVTHTRVIDLKTGHPYPQRSLDYMENWKWTAGRSVDEIASYMKYALSILHNIELPCDGITTPGGFGNNALPQLSQATFEACRDVYKTEIPHYFRHAFDKGPESVAPRVEYAAGLKTADPRCVVSIIACTGDWTGNWDATQEPQPDRFISKDLKTGRMVEIIERGEPACFLAHWTGIHHSGTEKGFRAIQEVVNRLEQRYQKLNWMRLNDISRYWTARELTAVTATRSGVIFGAPYSCPNFTFRFRPAGTGQPQYKGVPLQAVSAKSQLAEGKFWRSGQEIYATVNLSKGRSEIMV